MTTMEPRVGRGGWTDGGWSPVRVRLRLRVTSSFLRLALFVRSARLSIRRSLIVGDESGIELTEVELEVTMLSKDEFPEKEDTGLGVKDVEA